MKQKTKKAFQTLGAQMGGQGPETMNELVNILELPDDQFSLLLPLAEETLKKSTEDMNLQEQVLRVGGMTQKDIAATKEVIKNFTDIVDGDSDLSDAKKGLIHSLLNASIDIIEEVQEDGRCHISVNIKRLDERATIPTYAHKGDAGADVYALEDVCIEGGTTKIVRTGIAVEVPRGYMLNLYPRSGLSAKTPLRIANSVGCIDENYRGEVGVILHNTSSLPYNISAGDRIAQAILLPVPKIQWKEVDELSETDRGANGFGSTGNK